MQLIDHGRKPTRGARGVMGRLFLVCLLFWTEASTQGATIRWSSGESSGKPARIYIEGAGSVMLSDVRAAVPNAPLAQVSPGVWHLRAELQIADGASLALHGTKIGGDVNELRLQSNNNPASNAVVFISVDWGNLDIRSTKITSWDDAVSGPDTECASFHRAYIRCRSSLNEDGVTPNESRMDIIDSEISHLGCHEAEAYGLVWKVVAWKTNAPYGNLTNLYNLVNVYGDIMRSHIHNNYFGMYSFGAYGMRMADNEMDHNVGYGFDPHDDSDYLVIENNNVHHNGTHGIIASQRCNNIIIRNNTSWNNGGNGIMLHRYCDDSLIENNRSFHNGDSGIALFDNNRTLVRGNTCLYNFNSGIRCSVGASDNLIVSNEFAYGANFGLYLYKGIDAPKPGDDGHCKRNQYLYNYIHHNAGNGIFLTTSDDNAFIGNVFNANYGPLWFINGQRNRIEGNSIARDLVIRTQGNPSFLSSTIVRSQPVAMVQVDAYSATTFEDAGGKIFSPEEAGLATTVTPAGTTLTLTAAEIAKSSLITTRALQATPDAGVALITVSIWNISGDLTKRWLVQAGSSTRKITYRVGDLTPNIKYNIYKNGVSSSATADASGVITFQDATVSTGLVEYIVRL
ncbi:MAG: mannuronan 5-epimerase [Verrucomicrobiota bacterium]|jgi:parallel beta-helix repeat protein